jgi:ATPase subunit of ABC transporter with duplicated ATPase domains
MATMVLRGVSVAFGDGVPLFQDVSLRLSPGVYGVVGENGAGKTTLLRLAAGELAPDRGVVAVEPRGAIVALCRQTVDAIDPEVRQLAADTSGEALATRDRLGLDPEELERWAALSCGERRRWQLAAALHRAPDVLLADEPTNHLDADARARITAALARLRGTALVVSHDRALLDEVCTGTLRVHNGRVDVYTLPYSRARAEWEREARARIDEREARVKQRDAAARRLAEARDLRARADGMRSAGRRMKDRNDSDARGIGADFRAARAERHLGKLVGARRGELARAEAAVPEHEGGRAVGRSVFVGYEPAPRARVLQLDAPALLAGDRRVLSDVRVSVGRSARIHVAGPNGAGKTTLVRALVEASSLPRERLLHLPQDVSPGDAARLLTDVRALPPAERGRALSLVAALGVDPDRLLASAAPSPGEARKLALALALGRRAWALVLDEPTNHLDLPSIERMEAALLEYPGALVVVSHDERFAARVTEERWTLRDGKIHVSSPVGEGARARVPASLPRRGPGVSTEDRGRSQAEGGASRGGCL